MPADPVYVEREPPEPLRGVVVRLWYLRMPSPQRFELIVPIPAAHLILNLSGPYRVVRRALQPVDETLDGAFLSGVQTEYLVNENPAMIHHVGAELSPWALPAFGIAAPDAAGRVVPAESLLPGIGGLRVRLLAGPPHPDAAIDELAAVLTRGLDPSWRADHRVIAAVDELVARPETPIASLAERSGLGATRFVAVFRDACGVTPKRFAAVCRHHRFISGLPPDGEPPSWTELLANGSYYDQPHFIREFRRFTGMSPSAYLEHRRRFGAGDPSFLALDRV